MSARLLTPVAVSAGDRVRVVDPRRVLRVGYPKCAADYLAAVCEQHEETLREVFGFKASLRFPSLLPHPASTLEERVAKMPRQLRRALWDLAYLACRRDGFGGKERRVHLSEPLPAWVGVEFGVARVRTVMEGDYFGPSGNYDSWTGESDYEPGGLDNQRPRRLATMGGVLSGAPRVRTIVNLGGRPIEFPVEHLARAQQRACRGCVACADLCEHEYDCFCDLQEPPGVRCDGSGVLPAKGK